MVVLGPRRGAPGLTLSGRAAGADEVAAREDLTAHRSGQK